MHVLKLLGCLFTSKVPLTNTLLRKHCMARKRKSLTPMVLDNGVVGDANKFITVEVYVRKRDKMIFYAECREDFVEKLNMGCVGNLCKCIKDLSLKKQKEAIVSKCMLPYYYKFRAQLLVVVI